MRPANHEKDYRDWIIMDENGARILFVYRNFCRWLCIFINMRRGSLGLFLPVSGTLPGLA
jgi:hypothetical protein